MTKTTAFTLSVSTAVALVVATPTITPNGGSFSSSVSVSLQSATSGSAIYYTTDGSTPTQSSSLYTNAMTITSSATVNAKAFKSGYNPSAVASASFTNTITGTSSTASYYVGKNGSDSNSCTQARSSNTPKLTINAALACIGTSLGAGANQIVEVAAGVYTETLNQAVTGQTFPTGTSWSAPFTLQAKVGDQVTIRAGGGAGGFNMYLFLPTSANWFVIIQGFIFDGINTGGQFEVGSCCDSPSFIRFQNNELINNMAYHSIFVSRYASNIEILNNKIHGGVFTCTLPNCGGNGFTYPMYVSGNNLLIEGNEVYGFPSFGIHMYNAFNFTEAHNNIVRKNIFHDYGISTNGGVAILLSSGANNTAYNNLIYNATANSEGIRIWDGCNNCSAYSNTIYNVAGVGLAATGGANNSILKNNISFSNGTDTAFSGTGTVATNNLTTNPQFSNPAAGDFHLQSGSP
ncbi:MAG TPA: chitobiase/beta-hexosaminidase C-terminal domain-containing protein, partial [Nitrososphaera sp.]|nr:chitobiase/beta-hexosaminidase C-terminal domain-containing protein [Nitrososphaera sp.]